ncbi:hypothetical protein M8J76_011825 [Diaphorina citri]|nr:hypothetical protein M8J75_003177 [Diaphorina citri]KAI5719555.1 hypothetical protein M8J76_011825 [Diaphorina citri]
MKHQGRIMSGLLHKQSSHRGFGGQKASLHTFGPASGRRSIPVIVPCIMGEELPIDAELVNKGLSAISIKHKLKPDDAGLSAKGSKDHVIKCTISFTKKSSHGLIKQRNSFWNVHRPDLSKLNLDPKEITIKKVETFFRQHSSKCLVEDETGEENDECLVTATSCHDMSHVRGVLTLSRSFVIANDTPPEKEIPMSHEEH